MNYVRAPAFWIIALLAWPCAFLGADTIRIRSGIWNPFHGVAGSEAPGFMIELASNAFARAGHRLDYQNLPWSRSLDLARSGEIEGVAGASVSNVPDFIFPRNEQALNVNVFYVRAAHPWNYQGISSLEGQRVGLIQDYLFTADFDAYVAKNRLDPARIQVVSGLDALRQNLLKLENRRIDAYLDDRWVIEHCLRETGKRALFREAGVIGSVPVYMAFTPTNARSPLYADILSRAMDEFRSSGELARLLSRYGLRDWK